MYCSNCGKEIEDNMRFCIFCGNKVENEESEKSNALETNKAAKGEAERQTRWNWKSVVATVTAITVTICSSFAIFEYEKKNLFENVPVTNSAKPVEDKYLCVAEKVTTSGGDEMRTVYTYDYNGNLREQIDYDYYLDAVMIRTEFFYDDYNRVIRTEAYSDAYSDGSEQKCVQVYEYHEDGSYTVFCEDTGLYSYWPTKDVTEYDSRGNWISKVSTDKETGELLSNKTCNYSYDEQDHILEEEHFADGIYVQKESYEYDALGNLIMCTVDWGGDGVTITEYYYDENGNICKEVEHTSSLFEEYTSTFLYEYDNQNNLVRKTFMYEDAIANVTEYEYEWLSEMTNIDMEKTYEE